MERLTILQVKFSQKKIIQQLVAIIKFYFSGNQYKMIVAKDLGPACSAMWDPFTEHDVRLALKLSNFSYPYGTCPMQPGTYSIRNYTPDGKTDYLPPYIPGNERWKIRVYYCGHVKQLLYGFNA